MTASGGGGADGGSTPPPSANTISYSWVQQNGDAAANTQDFDTTSASFSALDSVNSLVFRVTATAGVQSDTTDVQMIIVEDPETAVFIDADFAGTSTGSIDAPMVNLTDAITTSDSDADFIFEHPAMKWFTAYGIAMKDDAP
ncbi:MAG: hypothetical protein ACI9PZ_002843 [Parvicella sp.]|jgi:hypothetical protein